MTNGSNAAMQQLLLAGMVALIGLMAFTNGAGVARSQAREAAVAISAGHGLRLVTGGGTSAVKERGEIMVCRSVVDLSVATVGYRCRAITTITADAR